MDELVKTFHIDWKLLIAQAINFVIVLFVLLYFGLKPLMKMMKARSEKIDSGIKNAQIIEEKLKEIDRKKSAEINQGRKQAQQIINQAEKESEDIKKKKLEETKKKAEKIIESAKTEIESNKKQMTQEIKSELGELILLAANKLSDKMLDEQKQKKLIDNMISQLENQDLDI